jgi:hypothetical protein
MNRFNFSRDGTTQSITDVKPASASSAWVRGASRPYQHVRFETPASAHDQRRQPVTRIAAGKFAGRKS